MNVSVIVPVYDDPEGIEDTIHSLLQLDYSRDGHEIIVVDNGSTDGTGALARELAEGHDHVYVTIEEEIQSSYAARNRGMDEANGTIYAFLDADMTVDPSWLSELTEYFEGGEVDYVGCNVELYLPDGEKSIFGQYSLAMGFPIEYYLEELNFAPTCCLAVRRDVVEDVGPFVTDYVSGGDAEFGQRVSDAGYDQHFANSITIYHPARTSFREHVSKARRLGRGQEQRYRNKTDTTVVLPLYHPRNWFPPHPVRYRSRLNGEWSLSVVCLFYAVRYLLKIAKLWGRVRRGSTRRDTY